MLDGGEQAPTREYLGENQSALKQKKGMGQGRAVVCDPPHVPGGEGMEWSHSSLPVSHPHVLIAVSELSEGTEIAPSFGGVSHLGENKQD